MDLFLALTSDDEDNIMSCLLAKRMGARRVLALINRRAYADLVQGTEIDIAISPAQAVIGELLAYVRRGDVAGRAQPAPRRGRGAGGHRARRPQDLPHGRAGRVERGCGLPTGAQVGAIVRGLHRPTAAMPAPAPRRRSSSRTTTPWSSPTTTSSSSCPGSGWCARSRSCSRSARPSCSDGPLAVVALVGRLVVLFALLMAVPLGFTLTPTTTMPRTPSCWP